MLLEYKSHLLWLQAILVGADRSLTISWGPQVPHLWIMIQFIPSINTFINKGVSRVQLPSPLLSNIGSLWCVGKVPRQVLTPMLGPPFLRNGTNLILKGPLCSQISYWSLLLPIRGDAKDFSSSIIYEEWTVSLYNSKGRHLSFSWLLNQGTAYTPFSLRTLCVGHPEWRKTVTKKSHTEHLVQYISY